VGFRIAEQNRSRSVTLKVVDAARGQQWKKHVCIKFITEKAMRNEEGDTVSPFQKSVNFITCSNRKRLASHIGKDTYREHSSFPFHSECT